MNRGQRVTPETLDKITWLLKHDSGAVMRFYRLLAGGCADEDCSDEQLRKRYRKGRKKAL